ncbi:uncharacterized protein LOC110850028 isoform X2 [Folsomia candida]|uniref:uncharacterized protein LOC110850028 isoform X2 n=1 Tax=Folsomia candida TaxID=158441 RepID=UPI0016050662|nr:uncharacterized protein LOC110850028 isoform X2 [Folsomia candida]
MELQPQFPNLPHLGPTPFFVGREKELNQLNNLFKPRTEIQTVLISGLGGVGKTELVKKFVATYTVVSNICWLYPSQQEFENEESKQKIMDKIYAKFTQNKSKDFPDIQNSNELITNNNHTNPVLVIDDISEMPSWLINFTKTLSDRLNCFTIITTQLRNLVPSNKSNGSIHLSGWNLPETETYLNLTLRAPQSPEEIKQVRDAFGGHPLTIQQAVCYILNEQVSSLQGKSYGLSHFLEEYLKNRNVSLLSDPLELESYQKTTLTMWDNALQNIETNYGLHGKIGYAILQIFGLLKITRVDDESDIIPFVKNSREMKMKVSKFSKTTKPSLDETRTRRGSTSKRKDVLYVYG